MPYTRGMWVVGRVRSQSAGRDLKLQGGCKGWRCPGRLPVHGALPVTGYLGQCNSERSEVGVTRWEAGGLGPAGAPRSDRGREGRRKQERSGADAGGLGRGWESPQGVWGHPRRSRRHLGQGGRAAPIGEDVMPVPTALSPNHSLPDRPSSRPSEAIWGARAPSPVVEYFPARNPADVNKHGPPPPIAPHRKCEKLGGVFVGCSKLGVKDGVWESAIDSDLRPARAACRTPDRSVS